MTFTNGKNRRDYPTAPGTEPLPVAELARLIPKGQGNFEPYELQELIDANRAKGWPKESRDTSHMTIEQVAGAALAAFWATVSQLHPHATHCELSPELIDAEAQLSRVLIRDYRRLNDPNSCPSCGRNSAHAECDVPQIPADSDLAQMMQRLDRHQARVSEPRQLYRVNMNVDIRAESADEACALATGAFIGIGIAESTGQATAELSPDDPANAPRPTEPIEEPFPNREIIHPHSVDGGLIFRQSSRDRAAAINRAQRGEY